MRLEDFYACLGGILTEELIRELRNKIAHAGPLTGQSPDEIVYELATSLGDEVLAREIIYAWGSYNSPRGGNFHTPKGVSNFIAKLAGTYSRHAVLDPTCGQGLLLSTVAEITKPSILHGIEINSQASEIAKGLLGPTASIICGDALALHTELLEHYDFICADAPLGVTLRPDQKISGLQERRCPDFSHGLTVWSAEHLSESGLAVINVSSSYFFSSQSKLIYTAISALGCRIRAAIHLPPGTLKYTGIGTYLVVIERGHQGDIFVGQYKEDDAHQTNLVRNFKRNKAGRQPALGRLCKLEKFRGFDALVEQARLRRLVAKTGWTGHPGSELITELQRFSRRSDSLATGVNSVFLRSEGRVHVTTQLDELIEGKESRERFVIHLHVNTDLVIPRYLAHWFNNSPLGQTTLLTISRGSLVARISKDDLLSLTYYLPPINEQHQILNAVGDLQRIRAQADELESRLWNGTEDSEKLALEISMINQEDRYEDWIESLPFPLASILWRHHASQVSHREHHYSFVNRKLMKL